MIQVKKFSGILNTDDPESEVDFLHHTDARNVTFRGDGANKRVQNIVGNRLVSNQFLPDGDNECIGSFYDSIRQRIIWFNYNSEGYHGIYIYNIISGQITPLLVSMVNSAEQLFDFSPNYPIASIVLIYTTEADGDILHWVGRNERPRKLNIQDALNGLYGSVWLPEYLTVARPMPLIAPVCAYKDDATVNINNLRKKLYEFRYRWVYKDFTKSTWSPYSKLFAPADPNDVAEDIDEQKNNRIDVAINIGPADAIKIEIAARQTLATAFSDPFLVTTLDKDDLDLFDNQLYTYQFFNNASYPFIDVRESDLLFDYVPKLANAVELLSGNVVIYGGITEGYDFDEVLDVDVTVSLVDFSTAGGLVATKIYENISEFKVNPSDPSEWIYESLVELTGTPTTGDIIQISYNSDGLAPNFISYTVGGGDTINTIVTALVAQFNLLVQNPVGQYLATVFGDGIKIVSQGTAAQFFLQINNIEVTAGAGSGPVDGVTNSIYKHKSRYGLGLVYFDEFGVTNGVVTDVDVMLIETPELTTSGGSASQIPKIDIEINHQPPIWATNFSFVRTTNLSVQALLSTVSCSTWKDADYAYIEITNQQNNQNNFPTYEFTDGDRVRIIGKYGVAVTTVYDFPVASFKIDPTISSATRTGSFILVPYDSVLAAFGTAGFNNYDIEIYTPSANINVTQQVFYEFGETYEVLDPGTPTRRHQGQSQNQIVGTQPALYSFIRGDFYIKKRKIPFAADLSSVTPVWIIDQSVSDLFPSKVVGNGRPFVVDEYAKETYFPTLLRWGLAYQENTSINQTNRFYYENFDEADRARGDIQRFKARDRILRVFQNRACGQYGVYSRFIKNNQGGNDLITSDDIITANNIQYYQGEYGIGTQYTSLVSASIQDYFVDPVRGYHVRLSSDGLTPISELYKGQYYIRGLLTPYNKTWVRENGFNAKIIGCYDFLEEQCMVFLQGGEQAPSSTNTLVIGSSTAGDFLNLAFSGTPIAGYQILIEVESPAESFTYTIQPGDSIASIITVLIATINNNSASFFASRTGNTLVITAPSITGGVSQTWNGGSQTISDYAFSFNERRNGYSSFYDINPEWIMSAEETIYAWKNGQLYIHDSDTYCNFFGVQYAASITVPFNQNLLQKKSWIGVTEIANRVWNCPLIYTNVNSYAGQRQESELIDVDFTGFEGNYQASFLRDIHSLDGIINGDNLKGNYLVAKFNVSNASSLVYLSELSVKFINSPVTIK